MANVEKFAYFYNKENKTESIGVVTSAHNWGKAKNSAEEAARKYLPRRIEEFYVLDVGRQAAFGTLMTDMLSVNFAEIIDFSKKHISNPKKEIMQTDLRHLPDAWLLTVWSEKMLWEDLIKGAQRLYMVRKYIEMCIERPELYSLGQFQRLLDIICEEVWQPRTLGFFAPLDEPKSGIFLFSDRELHRADYYGRSNLSIHSPLDLDAHLRINLLGNYSENYLPTLTVEVFEFSGFTEAVLLSLFHLIQERIAIKRCANCGKFFVPLARSDAIYCNRLAPQDNTKTCKEYGSKVLWYENVVSDEVARLARNVYSAKQMLAKRNLDKSEYMEMFEYFKAERKKWEELVKADTKTREEYAEWLRKMKLCKTKAELEES